MLFGDIAKVACIRVVRPLICAVAAASCFRVAHLAFPSRFAGCQTGHGTSNRALKSK